MSIPASPPPVPPGGGQSFSKAFDNMVQGSDDTVGLLAYALFKQAIREDAARGVRTNGATRDPTATMVEVFRSSAKRRLEEFANKAIVEATPDLQQSGFSNAVTALTQNLDAVQANLMTHVEQRTNWKSAIGTNLVAWVITLAVTVLILNAIYLPIWQADLIERFKTLYAPSTQQQQQQQSPGGG
ncbi:hypothetical protein [Azospirillum argentinense]|uniref:hypothetical protein n=1 Tax=Azospirillum argentinense TaxID=2970906 RepID=UPI0032DF12AF